MLSKAQKYLEIAKHTPECDLSENSNKLATTVERKVPMLVCTCGLSDIRDCFEGTYDYGGNENRTLP